jgi:hypothetical protein
MKCPSSAGRLFRRTTLVAALMLSALAISCRTTSKDVQRWANTAQGPRKLVAVMTHEKFPLDLRVEAGMTLVGMKPRAGRRIGITELVDALNALSEGERAKILGGMVPLLDQEIRKPPSGPAEARVDTSVPFKDAAYALLTNDGTPLVTDKGLVEKLRQALTDWASADFAARMDDSSQAYGMEQLLRMLGANGVRALPALINADAPKIDRICDLVADLGDPATKLEASKRLTALAQEVNSEKWLTSRRAKLDAANKASKINVSADRFEKQLEAYQDEELLRVFTSMKKIGGAPVVDFLLNYAGEKKASEKRRAPALVALEGKIDKSNKAQVDKILALAEAEDTPDPVRDAALRITGEMPRKMVVDRLYGMFDAKNWKIRWVAAELILNMSDNTQIDEFMGKLDRVHTMSITEPLRYGKLMGDMKGKADAVATLNKYMDSKYSAAVRLSALGYYYEGGTAADIAKVAKFSSDTTKVPECSPDQKECEWKCTVDQGGKQEEKTVGTVGDFVDACIKPALSKRGAAKAPAAGGK